MLASVTVNSAVMWDSPIHTRCPMGEVKWVRGKWPGCSSGPRMSLDVYRGGCFIYRAQHRRKLLSKYEGSQWRQLDSDARVGPPEHRPGLCSFQLWPFSELALRGRADKEDSWPAGAVDLVTAL